MNMRCKIEFVLQKLSDLTYDAGHVESSTLLTHNHPDHYDETDRKIPTNHPCPSRNRKVSGAH